MAPAGAVPVRPERVRGWEPDPFFDPALVAAWADEVDVVHLHFGYDHLTPVDAAAWVQALEDAGLPLVLTVHDLRNPHHPDRRQHDAVLALLVPAAAAVLTLTAGAAEEIAGRFGRAAVVVAHPTLVGEARTADAPTDRPHPGRGGAGPGGDAAGSGVAGSGVAGSGVAGSGVAGSGVAGSGVAESGVAGSGVVALHLKSLRTNVPEPLPVLEAVARGAAAGGGRVEVHVHPSALDDPRLDGLSDLRAVWAARGHPLDVRVHERLSHVDLERALRRAQVTVLPYRWGTHSGWLELAHDLGTRVVAPSGGHYADQWAEVVTYPYDETHGLDATGLAAAVERSLRLPPVVPADPATRRREAEAVRDTHAEVYARVRALAKHEAPDAEAEKAAGVAR